MKTQEELLEELLEEVRQTRRYAEEMRRSSTRIIDIVSTVFDTDGRDITGPVWDEEHNRGTDSRFNREQARQSVHKGPVIRS